MKNGTFVVVELKSATAIYPAHIAQTASYLKTLKMPRGILINFPYPKKAKPEIRVVES